MASMGRAGPGRAKTRQARTGRDKTRRAGPGDPGSGLSPPGASPARAPRRGRGPRRRRGVAVALRERLQITFGDRCRPQEQAPRSRSSASLPPPSPSRRANGAAVPPCGAARPLCCQRGLRAFLARVTTESAAEPTRGSTKDWGGGGCGAAASLQAPAAVTPQKFKREKKRNIKLDRTGKFRLHSFSSLLGICRRALAHAGAAGSGPPPPVRRNLLATGPAPGTAPARCRRETCPRAARSWLVPASSRTTSS